MKQIILIILILPMSLFAQKAESYFFVFLNTNPDKEVLDSASVSELQALHLANIDRLYTEGKIVAAGPFSGGGGLFVFRDSSLESVNKLLYSDPAIAANRFLLEVFPFEFTFGGICPYLDPVEMITLSFIRLPADDETRITRRMLNLTTRFEKELLASGIFNQKEGGFLVVQTDEENTNQKLEKKNEARQSTLQVRTLYIAKGTFCSKPEK
jgi:uncharacterized protein YciI